MVAFVTGSPVKDDSAAKTAQPPPKVSSSSVKAGEYKQLLRHVDLLRTCSWLTSLTCVYPFSNVSVHFWNLTANKHFSGDENGAFFFFKCFRSFASLCFVKCLQDDHKLGPSLVLIGVPVCDGTRAYNSEVKRGGL